MTDEDEDEDESKDIQVSCNPQEVDDEGNEIPGTAEFAIIYVTTKEDGSKELTVGRIGGVELFMLAHSANVEIKGVAVMEPNDVCVFLTNHDEIAYRINEAMEEANR